jgi:acetyl esterase/lipase
MLFVVAIILVFSWDETREIKLWPNGTPHAPPKFGPEEIKERGEDGFVDRHVRNIHVPTLTIYRPSADTAQNAAIVVCPGGGYHILALDKEGHDVARWLASRGIVGIVLKYRLPKPNGHVYPPDAPLSDAQRAIRYARVHATDLGIHQDRIGILGFSAGGHLASTAATHFAKGDASASDPLDRVTSRPDFTVLVYPVTTFDPKVGHAGSAKSLCGDNPSPDLVHQYCNDRHVNSMTPPTFLVHTSDDPVKVENSIAFYQALRKAKVPAEMHIFSQGGHGYGIRKIWQGQKDPPVSKWPDLCEDWMKRVVFKANK